MYRASMASARVAYVCLTSRSVGKFKRRTIRFALALCTILLAAGNFAPGAKASLYCTPTSVDCLGAIPISYSVNHSGDLVKAYYSDVSNTDVGSQNEANVIGVLEGWFGTNLTFVGGGDCSVLNIGCTADDANNNSGDSTKLGNVYGVHFGNNFLAFLYSNPINDFHIEGIAHGVSNIYVFNSPSTVPIPAAAWLFGSGLACLGWVSRRRRKASHQAPRPSRSSSPA
jgi:hypothetical protein